ncbi:hypothetical protein GF362_03500 [Candidatus Dojkabacteria bacterium]|nr:hypothetical protein [Candidatus Dojkabacteria bacterium]
MNVKTTKGASSKVLLFISILGFFVVTIVIVWGIGFFRREGESSEKIMPTTELEPSQAEVNEKEIQTGEADDEGATIAGSVSYPSENLPAMEVCAVNTADEEEICTHTEEGESEYSITVDPGKYLVYAVYKYEADCNEEDSACGSTKAYYTKCDTYDDSFIPECNPNAGPPEDNGKWNKVGFICYEDAVCKAAFTPLAISVESGESIKLKKIVQGWYIPCNHDTEMCSDPEFDVWADYLE